jgi:hypothetical protein
MARLWTARRARGARAKQRAGSERGDLRVARGRCTCRRARARLAAVSIISPARWRVRLSLIKEDISGQVHGITADGSGEERQVDTPILGCLSIAEFDVAGSSSILIFVGSIVQLLEVICKCREITQLALCKQFRPFVDSIMIQLMSWRRWPFSVALMKQESKRTVQPRPAIRIGRRDNQEVTDDHDVYSFTLGTCIVYAIFYL